MNQKIAITLFVGAILFIGGIWFALLLPDTSYQKHGTASNNGTAAFITDLRIGTPVRPEFSKQKNPPIKQKTEYTVQEPIMLRGTTTDEVEEDITLEVRLLDEKGRVISLQPSNVVFAPGTSTYCCWTIDTPGAYTMQIFRPNNSVTSLPLKIVKDFSTQQTQ